MGNRCAARYVCVQVKAIPFRITPQPARSARPSSDEVAAALEMNSAPDKKSGGSLWLFCSSALAVLAAAGCASPADSAIAAYPYDTPLSSPGTQFGNLPPVVQRTIRAEAGAVSFDQIEKRTNGAETYYVVQFSQPEMHPPLYVQSNGSVLYPTLQVAVGAEPDKYEIITGSAQGRLDLGEVPVKVAWTIQQSAPTQEIQSIAKLTAGDETYYEVQLQGSGSGPSKLLITEEGKLIQKR